MKVKKENFQKVMISVGDVINKKSKVIMLHLLRSNFFEEVSFENKSVENRCKENFAIWVRNLEKYKHIRIEKFKDLFSKLNEVHFPVKIIECKGAFSTHISLLDNKQEKYYFINDNQYCSIYVIGRRHNMLEPFIDRDFEFKILKNDGISFIRTGVLEIDRNGKNKDIYIEFTYDDKKSTTKVISRSYKSDKSLIISYPKENDEFDEIIQKYLFEITETKSYYNNVFPILAWMCSQIFKEDISISIMAQIKNNISSQICVENGIVTKYIRTQVINECEIHEFKSLLSENLKTFLSKKIF